MAALADGLAPGSCLAISHLTADFAPQQVTAAAGAYNASTPIPVTARSHAQVTGLFGDVPLVPPGVVPVTEWRPDAPGPAADLYAGIARIPHPHHAAGARRRPGTPAAAEARRGAGAVSGP